MIQTEFLEDVQCKLNHLKTLTGKAQLSYLQSIQTPLLKQILLYTYDPHKLYKIDELKYNKIDIGNELTYVKPMNENRWERFIEHLDSLSNKPAAKDEDVYRIKCFIQAFIEADFLKDILFKDLKLHMSIKSFQKVWHDFCVEPQVQLAQMYEGKNFNNGLYSRKFDGKRMYIMDGLPYSRANKLCYLPPVQHILDQIPQSIKQDFVLDGECLYFNNGKEDFQKGISLTSSKERTNECDNIYYVIFDIIPKDKFISKEPYIPFCEELNNIFTYFTDLTIPSREVYNSLYTTKFNNIYIAKQTTNREELEQYRLENNWEGLMYRNADSPYEYKRSKNLLKIKTFYDAEYIVDDIEVGTKPMLNDTGEFEEKECMAAILFKHKGFVVRCGSGFSDEQRIDFMNNPSKIVGKTVKIKYFEETKNKQGELSLRFPTFLCFRNNNEETL